MARNPWVQKPRMTDEEINARIEQFKNQGGEVINIPDNFNTIKANSKTAVKLGVTYRKLEEAKRKSQKND